MSSIFTDSFSSEDDMSMVIDNDNIIAVKDTRTPTNAMRMLTVERHRPSHASGLKDGWYNSWATTGNSLPQM